MNLFYIKSEEEWQQILDDLCEALSMPTAPLCQNSCHLTR